MKLKDYLRNFTIAPIQLTGLEMCIAASACLIAIFSTAAITQACAYANSPILIASMGASAVIVFAIPGSPLAQPWPLVGGQMLSALVGICAAHYLPDISAAAALAVGLSVWLMLLLRCLHPPGAATALAPVLSGPHWPGPDFGFLLAPVGINVAAMLFMALAINRLLLRRDYPARIQVSRQPNRQNPRQGDLAGIDQADIDEATSGFNQFLDVGADDLRQILTRLQLRVFEKNAGVQHCGDIMRSDIITVEYATEVEAAWALMHEQHLKALPVLDKTGRVIGIVTRYDFLKNLKLTPYQSFQEKWLAFIKRSLDVTDRKSVV